MPTLVTLDSAMRGKKRRNIVVKVKEDAKKAKKVAEPPVKTTVLFPQPPVVDEELQSIQATFPPNFRLVRRIGKGGYGEVFHAMDEKSNVHCAIKLMNGDSESGLAMTIVREAAILRGLQPHEHIVKLQDVIFAGKAVGFVLELCTMDLWMYMHRKKKLDISEQRSFTRQILEGVAYMHARRVAHRDLKPSNILLMVSGESVTLKIADFGLGRPLNSSGVYTPKCTTVIYRSPEVL